ncbi:MAG TPA: biopolymer transporter ExbB, partial [Spirochaetia bacterium]|nr:biopolymer transporter ExbB [Spirochaetia bacterium]
GLFVAIPCIVFYNIFTQRVSSMVNDMEVRSTEFIQYLKHGS